MDESSSGATPYSGPDGSRDDLRALLQSAAVEEYEVHWELGRGGMATVYLARDLSLDRWVALKVLDPALTADPSMVERFKLEARTAANLTHPHIIPIYAVRQTERLLYFVMRCVEGRGLDDIITEIGQLPLDMVQTILHQVAGALAHAHRRGVIHRDIKPANIMIDTDGWAVVTDFGIAKVHEASGLTSTGTAVGTPYYMSPEQYSDAILTGAADQYSLGIVAWEMLTGQLPFQRGSPVQMMRAHCFDEVPPVESLRRDCPPPLAATVARMLAKEPLSRFGGLDEVADQLAVGPLGRDDPVRVRMITLARSGANQLALSTSVAGEAFASRGVKRPWAAVPRWQVAAGVALATVVGVAGWFVMRDGSAGAGPTPTEMVAAGSSTVGPPESSGDGDDGGDGAGAVADTTSSGITNRPVETEPPPSTPRGTSTQVRQEPTEDPIPVVPTPHVEEEDAEGDDSMPLSSTHAHVLLGVPPLDVDAFVYINGVIQPISNPDLRWWRVPVGVVRLSVRAEGCEPVEEVRTVAPGDSVVIGRRAPSCD